MRILVIGAGVVGLTSAYYLNRAGHDVTVVDRHDDVARETSYGNGGQLSYSYVAPLAGPGIVSKLPYWLLRRDSPVRWRARLSIEQWRWGLEFLIACTRDRNERTTRTLLQLSMMSRALMHELISAEPTLDFDFVQSGKLVVHRDAEAMKQAVALLGFQRSLGCEQHALDARACVDLEPALEAMGPSIAGGIYTPSEDTADCRRFCESLATTLRARGVRFELGTSIDALTIGTRDRVEAIHGRTSIDADHIVVASGAQAAPLLRLLGIRVPVYPLKGYSLTYNVSAETAAPRISVTDAARKVVYARLGDRLRVAGMADIDGYALDLDAARLATLRAQSAALFPDLAHVPVSLEWAGLRPATPRGTPIIGATRFPNLWLNVGHGALGFTLATGSAALLARLMSGDTPDALHESFALAR